MALHRFKLREGTDSDGRPVTWIGPETEETPCELCGAEAHRQICPGDGRPHHHGCVHTVDRKLIPVCNDCIAKVDAEWTAHRKARAD
jgi:hypothetical protein